MGLSVFYWVSLGFKVKMSAKQRYLKKLQNFLIGLKGNAPPLLSLGTYYTFSALLKVCKDVVFVPVLI